jgi:hypothetical protein
MFSSPSGLVVILGSIFLGGLDVPVKAGEKAPIGDSDKKIQSKTSLELRENLNQPITAEFEAGPLKDALGFIQERYGIQMVMDNVSFQTDLGIPDFENQMVRMPRVVGVKIRTVLRLILAQVNGNFYPEDGVLRVVSQRRMEPQFQLRRPIDAVFTKEPVNNAFQILADATGTTIVLDIRVGEKGQKAITATFDQVPLETAVLVLADMVDLKTVTIDNVVYVTTKENAKEFSEKAKEKPRPPENK